MTFQLDTIVPWGRSMAEYVRMFALTAEDLDRRILGCGDGPASFNAEMHRQGRRVVSADPLYAHAAGEIRQRIHATFSEVVEKTRANRDNYIWREIPSVEAMAERRMAAMECFLADYPAGRDEGRYVPCSLPPLPFADGAFDLVLCGHLLFLYADHLSHDFHVRAVQEMVRVGGEVRLFPLLNTDSKPSPHVAPVLAALRAEGFACEIRTVDYEFQRGGMRWLS